jgi:hypothetical protein
MNLDENEEYKKSFDYKKNIPGTIPYKISRFLEKKYGDFLGSWIIILVCGLFAYLISLLPEGPWLFLIFIMILIILIFFINSIRALFILLFNRNKTKDVLPQNIQIGHKASKPVDINWYSNQLMDGKIIQVVLSVPISSIKKTEYGMIMLPYDKFPILSSQSWCTGFVRMTEKPIPYQMIRVDKFDEDVIKSDLTIAFSFCKLPSGGIFLTDTRIENESIGIPVRQKFPHLPYLQKPIVEWIVGIGDNYSMKMIQDVFSSSVLNIIIANSNGIESRIMDSNGSMIKCVGPCAHHERSVALNSEVSDLLKKELQSLLDYDKTVPNIRRNIRIANKELSQLLPLDKDPISDRQ